MDEISTGVSRDEITFEEAIAYFGSKIILTSGQFRELTNEYKSLAFTVSGYTKVSILKKFYDELLDALENGGTFRDFRTRMNAFLKDKGEDGLSSYQAENIFRTNIQTAYQVGHYARLTEPGAAELRPYWKYNAVIDGHTRPAHEALDGRVFPADSPFWDTWYPPNGYKCRCTVTSLSKRQVKERGLTVESEAPRGAELPDGRFINILPDPGFDCNPAKKAFTPDLTGYPDVLVKAYKKQTEV